MTRIIPVVIPYYRSKDKLNVCTSCLNTQIGVDVDLYIRDNSNDNIFYTAAINEGIRHFLDNAQHEYILVLNQDANLRPDCLIQLCQVMDLHHDIGIACPRQITSDRLEGWCGSMDAFPYGKGAPPPADETPFHTYWANGACMLLRRKMIQEIGLLDKNMRFICSDSDYSYTARSMGWKIAVVPSAIVEHELSSSVGTIFSPEVDVVKCEDILYFAKKWLTGDLYRSMAFEGPQLTVEVVKQYLNEIEAALNHGKTLLTK